MSKRLGGPGPPPCLPPLTPSRRCHVSRVVATLALQARPPPPRCGARVGRRRRLGHEIPGSDAILGHLSTLAYPVTRFKCPVAMWAPGAAAAWQTFSSALALVSRCCHPPSLTTCCHPRMLTFTGSHGLHQDPEDVCLQQAVPGVCLSLCLRYLSSCGTAASWPFPRPLSSAPAAEGSAPPLWSFRSSTAAAALARLTTRPAAA